MCDESARCFGNGVDFAGMTGADLRGATIDHLWDAPPSLGAARLDRVTTHLNGAVDLDFVQLANGVGNSGLISSYHGPGIRVSQRNLPARSFANSLRSSVR